MRGTIANFTGEASKEELWSNLAGPGDCTTDAHKCPYPVHPHLIPDIEGK